MKPRGDCTYVQDEDADLVMTECHGTAQCCNCHEGWGECWGQVERSIEGLQAGWVPERSSCSPRRTKQEISA